jgi:hypothetical protein
MNVEGRTGPPGNALIVINGAAAVVVGTSPVADRQTAETGVQMSWTAMPLKRAVVTTMLVTAQTNGRIVETNRGCHLVALAFLRYLGRDARQISV